MSKLSLIEHLMLALQDSIAIIRDRDLKLEDARDTIELQRAQLTKKADEARESSYLWTPSVNQRTAELPEHVRQDPTMFPYHPSANVVTALAEERTPAELYASIEQMVSNLHQLHGNLSAHTNATDKKHLADPLRYLMMYGAALFFQIEHKHKPLPSSGARIGLELLQRSRELAFAASTYWTKTSEHFEKISEPEDACEIPDDYYIPDDLKAFWFSVEMAVANANDVIRRTDKLVNTGMWSVQDGGPPWQVVQVQNEPEATDPRTVTELSLLKSSSHSLCSASILFARDVVEYFAAKGQVEEEAESDHSDAKLLPESLRKTYTALVEARDQTRILIKDKKKKSRTDHKSALAFDELMSVMAIPDNVRKVKGRNKRIRTMLDVMSHKEITDHAYHLQSYLERELRKMEGLLESKPLTINLAKDLVSRLKQLRTAWMEQFDTAHDAFIRSSVIGELASGMDVCKKAKSFMDAVVDIYDVQVETHEFEHRDDIDVESALPPKLYKPYAELEEVRTKFLAHARLKKANKKK